MRLDINKMQELAIRSKTSNRAETIFLIENYAFIQAMYDLKFDKNRVINILRKVKTENDKFKDLNFDLKMISNYRIGSILRYANNHNQREVYKEKIEEYKKVIGELEQKTNDTLVKIC